MRNKRFDRLKKTLAILLVVCFTLSVTVTSVNAADEDEKYKDAKGYIEGYEAGYKEGKEQGDKDCEQYGSIENLSKIPSPTNETNWTEEYTDSYNIGYKKGYIDGYSGSRYECLKKIISDGN